MKNILLTIDYKEGVLVAYDVLYVIFYRTGRDVLSAIFFFFFKGSGTPRVLPSSPTRRSPDLPRPPGRSGGRPPRRCRPARTRAPPTATRRSTGRARQSPRALRSSPSRPASSPAARARARDPAHRDRGTARDGEAPQASGRGVRRASPSPVARQAIRRR